MRLEAFAVERAIAADPDLFLLGRLAASQQPAAPAAAGPRIPYRYPATLSYENSSIKKQISAVLLQMACRFADKHGECVSCLGAAHAETVLTGTEYHHCGDMGLSSLRSRLAFFSESKPAPRALSLFSSQEPARKKQRGRGSQRPEMSELMLAVPHSFPVRAFSRSLHPPGPASLCGCERSGLIR